jgi:hypothetical protein
MYACVKTNTHTHTHTNGLIHTHTYIHIHTHTNPGKSKQYALAKTPGKNSSSSKPTEAGSSKKSDSAKKSDGSKPGAESSSAKKLVEVKVPMDVWKEELVKVLSRLTRHERAWPFLEPVDPVEVSDAKKCSCVYVFRHVCIFICVTTQLGLSLSRWILLR